MARKPDKLSLKKQSFFKILLGDFSQRLRIPPKFIENFNGRSLRRCAITGPSGKWWNVELEKGKNGLFLQDGWQHFVKEHQLEEGDFLIFRFDGESKFEVTIYDRTACEKDVEVAEKRSGSPVSLASAGQAQLKDESVDRETESYNENCEKKASNSSRSGIRVTSGKRPKGDHAETIPNGSILFKSKNLCFTVNFKKHHQHRMNVPQKLAIAEGLMTKNCLMIEDPAGRSWLVKFRFRWTGYSHRAEMITGLAECCRANQIEPGDTLIFEFVKENLAKVHIFRKGSNSAVLDVPDLDN